MSKKKEGDPSRESLEGTGVWNLHDNGNLGTVLDVSEKHFLLSSLSIISPTSFVYGESVDVSNFILLEDLECHFQPLNITLQVSLLPQTLPLSLGSNRRSRMGLLLKVAQGLMLQGNLSPTWFAARKGTR